MFGSGRDRPRRRLLTKQSLTCKFCDEPSSSSMVWPDGVETAVCSSHSEFIVSGMGEVNLLVSGSAA